MYHVIHFEALGDEAAHLEEETRRAKASSGLPPDFRHLITPLTVQEFCQQEPAVSLPRLITMKTHSRPPQTWVEADQVPGLVTRSAGYDHVEHLSSRIHVASLRNYCVDAVAQTAIKFLYACAGRLNDYTRLAGTFNRKDAPSFIELTSERRAALFGVGRIGKAIHDLLKANGLDVVGVDIREDELDPLYGGSVRFVSADEAIATSDIVVNAMNLTRDRHSPFYNVGYFSLELMMKASRPLIFINVTRGEIAPEETLLTLYDSGKIQGIGLDVFSDEATLASFLSGGFRSGGSHVASAELIRRSLSREANIYVQPHQGFNSDRAARQKAIETVRHLEAWFRNDERCFDEELPYYRVTAEGRDDR